MAINVNGWIVGWSQVDNVGFTPNAFLVEFGGAIEPLDPIPGRWSIANDVNDLGTVVGTVRVNGSGNDSSFVWTRTAGFQVVSPPQVSATYITLNAINNLEIATGSTPFNGVTRSLLRMPDGTIELLGPENLHSVGRSINDKGVVVGDLWESDFNERQAMIWEEGVGMRNLNELIPSDLGLFMYSALDINGHGQIVAAAMIERRVRGVLLTPVVPEPTSATLAAAAVMMMVALRLLRRRFQTGGARQNPGSP
jgi:uncharacterized membrane protein